MFKYELTMTDFSRFYNFYKKLFDVLYGVVNTVEEGDTLTVYIKGDSVNVLDVILESSQNCVPYSKEEVEFFDVDMIPEYCTIYVVDDKDLCERLHSEYPKRNICNVTEGQAEFFIDTYSTRENVTDYLLYPSGVFMKLNMK